jgi:Ice-binding-like
MKRLETSLLLVLLSLAAACKPEGLLINNDAGNPEVGSTLAGNTPAGNTDAAKAGTTDAVKPGNADAAKSDAGTTNATDTRATNTDTARSDVGSTDAANVDRGNTDIGNTGVVNTCGQAPVVLGAAGNFVVLAGSTVTNTGPSSVTGDLGVSPGTAVTGFGPGILAGAQHAGDLIAGQGEAALTTAYNDAARRILCPVTVAGNLGGQTLTPGLYKSTSSLEISSGNLVLDARGAANAVFIFQMASTLTTTSGRQVMLIGGAKAANVFWQVGTSATLGSTSAFQGTIMADQAITMTTGATLNGRALARIAAVTLDSNIIVKPTP